MDGFRKGAERLAAYQRERPIDPIPVCPLWAGGTSPFARREETCGGGIVCNNQAGTRGLYHESGKVPVVCRNLRTIGSSQGNSPEDDQEGGNKY